MNYIVEDNSQVTGIDQIFNGIIEELLQISKRPTNIDFKNYAKCSFLCFLIFLYSLIHLYSSLPSSQLPPSPLSQIPFRKDHK